jgi:UPF0176 protein
MPQVVAAFYKFVSLPDCHEQQQVWLDLCLANQVKGTILLAPEGINGTIAGDLPAIDRVLATLRADPRLTDLVVKESPAKGQPFERMKVKLKSEIVTLGLPEIDPSQQVGTYVSPQEWNALIIDPEVLVIDTRNEFEVRVGTFPGAMDPQIKSFRQFPDYVRDRLDPDRHTKIAMFCTGGIRCEKASALLLAQGFAQVYHLQGGILKYLEEVPPEASLWQGECFVFDQRVSVGARVAAGSYLLCEHCGHPVSPAERDSPQYQAGACPYCPEVFGVASAIKR